MKRMGLGAVGMFLGLGLVALVCCDRQEKNEAGSVKSGSARAIQVKETVAPAEPRDEARPSRSEEEVRGVVATWLKAQNDGDFEAYSVLYATRFTGVKRSGGRTFHFNRAEWIEDRQKMFRKPMVVEASDIEVRTAGNTSNVELIQTWTSGAYSDQGPKRLLLVEEKGKLVIAIEEMLASEMKGLKRDQGPGGFHFMLNGGVELHGVKVPLGSGKAKLKPGGPPRVAVMSVSEEDLEPSVRALKGKTFRVDGTCEAKVTGFEVVSRAELHFGQEQRLTCTLIDEPCTPASSDEIAEIVAGIGNAVLVARLDGCQSGDVARLASEPKFIRSTPVKDPKLEQQALAAFAQLKEVQDQAEPGDPQGVPAGWWKGKEEVHIYEHPLSHRTIVSVAARHGEHCGSPLASCLQTWEVTSGGLSPLHSCTSAEQVVDAFDVNGDGSLELLLQPFAVYGEERSLFDAKNRAVLLRQFYHYGDCSC